MNSMEHININTSQNVNIEHDAASIGDRMLAHLIDYLVFFGYFLILLLLSSFSFNYETSVMIILLLPVLCYDIFFEYFFNGQSLGKKVAKIKVVRLDGSSPTLANLLIRWIFRIIDNILVWGSVAVITLICNSRGQRLGDIAAGTAVVKSSRKIHFSDSSFFVAPEDYVPVFSEVQVLSEKDINTVKELYLFSIRNGNALSKELLSKTRGILEKKMNISPKMETLSFFQTILKDYSYFNR